MTIKAPNLKLPSTSKKEYSLKDSLGKYVVLYFYPKDETTVCTAQACSFRDSYQDFQDLGAEVIGISSDDEKSHQNFAKNHNLPFTLLSDENQHSHVLFTSG